MACRYLSVKDNFWTRIDPVNIRGVWRSFRWACDTKIFPTVSIMDAVAEPADQHDMIFASVACANLRSGSPCKALDRVRKTMVDTYFVRVRVVAISVFSGLHKEGMVRNWPT
jgi:hypothetical protein